MSTLRIAYILKKYPRLSETFILNEILELERQGVEVTIFSLRRPDDGRFHPGTCRLKGNVVYVPEMKGTDALPILREMWPSLRKHRTALAELMEEALLSPDPGAVAELVAGLLIAREVNARRFDHLHAHFATIASSVARIVHAMTTVPYSFTAHAMDIYRHRVQPDRFGKMVKDAAFVVTVCDANKTYIERDLLGRSEPKLRRIYNGIDLGVFAPRAAPPVSTPLVLGVGRLIEKKGFHVLLNACAALRDGGEEFRCVIVGDGEDRERLHDQCRELGLDEFVEFLGARTQDEVLALIRQASVVCLPCVTAADGNKDALPTVLLEALSCGVPAVSTPVGGIAEILGTNAGLLVPENSADSLASAISSVLRDRALAAKLARNGRERAEKLFDLHQNVSELKALMTLGARTSARDVLVEEIVPLSSRDVLSPDRQPDEL
jgi:glycosyltransferase involved in cell wall biosynthesis